MDYGNILGRAWRMIWEHKFLFGLSLIASVNVGLQLQNILESEPIQNLPSEVLIPTIAIIVVVVVILKLILMYVSSIGFAGLVSGVYQIETEGQSTFGQGFTAGLQRSFPVFLIFLIYTIIMLPFLAAMIGGQFFLPEDILIVFIFGICACLYILVIPLSILYILALQYCVINEQNPVESLKSAWGLFKDKLGSVLVLWLILFAISLAIILPVLAVVLGFVFVSVLFVVASSQVYYGPDALKAIGPLVFVFCCCLLPALWVLGAGIRTFTSTAWTLAWLEWVGELPSEPRATETDSAESDAIPETA